MNRKWLFTSIILLAPWHVSHSGNQPAANQSQPTSSAVTPSSSSSVIQNAVIAGSSSGGQTLTVDSVSPGGTILMTIEAGGSAQTGQSTAVVGTAQVNSDGQVIVTFQDRSTVTFNASDFQ